MYSLQKKEKKRELDTVLLLHSYYSFFSLTDLQMASLKDTIAKKDEEIERLHLLKDLKNGYPSISGEQQGTGSMRYAKVSSPK